MPMIIKLATAQAVTATGAAAPVRLDKTPFLGGQGHEALCYLDAPVGGAGVVKIQGHASDSATAPLTADVGWYDVLTLNSASGLSNEIADLPQWIRSNVTTVGTGTVNITLEGVQ